MQSPRCQRWLTRVAGFLLAAAATEGSASLRAQDATLPPVADYRVLPAVGPISVDGELNEADWSAAQSIPLSWEFTPGSNVAPPVETACRVTFDRTNLYLGCHAADPRPAEIRAHYAERDDRARTIQDDHLIVLIDTFNDDRRGFQFRVNPLGVQMDAILSKAEGFEDFSWDAVWTSASRVTDSGYDVEVAIPFSSLRFPSTDEEQTWGFVFERSYPRNLRHRIRSAAVDLNSTCVLCRANRVVGFRGISPGSAVELVPTLTARRTDERVPFPGGDFVPTRSTSFGDIDPDVGLDLRWGVTTNLSLRGTANPDFSQVEADVAQLAVNRRFALFFPEKRPFFLEGADFFLTPLQTVFTRTVADPDGGLKLTGKEGRNAIGVFATRDATSEFLFPTNQRSQAGTLDREAYAGVVRYRRDIGAASYVGALYTGRGGDAYFNHVYGIDALSQLSRSNSVRVQYVRSRTDYPDPLATAFSQPAGAFDGGGFSAQFAHFSRRWVATAQYTDLTPEFRADLGFIPRVDLRTADASLGHVVRGSSEAWFTRLQATATFSRSEDHSGALTDRAYRLDLNYQGPRQSDVTVSPSRLTMVVLGVAHELNRVEGTFRVRPSGSATLDLEVRVGDFVDFANNRKSFGLSITSTGQFNAGPRLAFDVSHVLQRLEYQGAKVFTANLIQARALYHFDVRTFVRAIVQYRNIQRDPLQYVSAVAQTDKRMFTQFLFSYKVSPQTAFYAGYTDNHRGSDTYSIERSDRTVFLKIGYAVRP